MLTINFRDSDNSESVLQIKNQSIDMTSGQTFQSNKKYFVNHLSLMKSQLIPKLERELIQQQRAEKKAAAYERELKMQKSLSEECENLGIDEPSTSDLFPEADLLFDTNHSPSFDQSSQDASCSQPLGMKSYNSAYFRSLDSSSGSRDASPTSDFKTTERKKSTSQRTRVLKDSLKRGKREKEFDTPSKHMRLTLDSLSQDEASNSNSDMSRLSPTNLVSLENDSSKDMSSHRVKLASRSGSKEGTPSSASSIPCNIKLDIDLDSESLPPTINVNNASMISSGDESLTLLSSNAVDHHTISSPLSPLGVAGPLLSTHNKYTYTNKKRMPSSKVRMDSYMTWDSPMSERMRFSSDDEDSSISESIGSQTEDNVALSNGVDDSVQTLKSLSSDRNCTYVKRKEKLVNARVVLNRADHKAATMALSKRIPKTAAESIPTTESMVMSNDKVSEASEDETNTMLTLEPADCRARRSSLRGHVKKGCTCCNGSPERLKKKPTTVKSTDHKLKKRPPSKQPGKKR